MSAMRVTAETYGSLDSLVTCAGIQRYGTVADTGEETRAEVCPRQVDGHRQGSPRREGQCDLPGSVDTLILRASARLFSDGSEERAQGAIDGWGQSDPLGRITWSNEVAEVVGFLAQPAREFRHREDIHVDGGLLAALTATTPHDHGDAKKNER
jgi:NAD(P)-dependent dehydrogenase (short-subunit alcohol dehydrogenase family)